MKSVCPCEQVPVCNCEDGLLGNTPDKHPLSAWQLCHSTSLEHHTSQAGVSRAMLTAVSVALCR